jgi:hypothetical protein
MDDALQRFHQYREIFRATGLRDDFNLPRQHSLTHYLKLIRAFGAPNGLCSSITESKHIKAVKEPWRRSSRFDALNQMLLTNQRLDKLAASRVDFTKRGMLKGTCLLSVLDQLHGAHFNHVLNLSLPGLNVADPNPEPPCPLLDERPLLQVVDDGNGNHSSDDGGDNVGDIGEDDGDEGDGIVAGPTVEAYVELAKTSRTFLLLDVSRLH